MIREYLYRCQIRTATVIDESTEVAIFPRIDRIAFVLKKKKITTPSTSHRQTIEFR